MPAEPDRIRLKGAIGEMYDEMQTFSQPKPQEALHR